MEQNLKEKLELILDETKLKKTALSDLTNIPISFFTEVKRGKVKNITYERACAINKVLPQYSVDWLMEANKKQYEVGDITIPIDLSQGKREVSGDGNTYIEGGDAVAVAKLQMEIDALKQQVATLQEQLKEAREERDKANARIDQYILGTLNRQ